MIKLKNGFGNLTLEETLALLGKELQPLPSAGDLHCILLKCRRVRNSKIALQMYAYLSKRGLEADRLLGNTLVQLLVEVGSVKHATQVFNLMDNPHEISWNSLIIGCARCGDFENALKLYDRVILDGSVKLSKVTFIALLKCCARSKDLEAGNRIHSHIDIEKDMDAFLGSTLIDMYIKCGCLERAEEVFDKLQDRNVVSWNTLISGYVDYGQSEKALDCLQRMHDEAISPSIVTFVCVLKVCIRTEATVIGDMIHTEVLKLGLEKELILGSVLIDMYCKRGQLAEAHAVFKMLPIQDVVSWTALIAGYTERDCADRALEMYDQMETEGIPPNAVTSISAIKACSKMLCRYKGQEIHSETVKKGFEQDPIVGSTLVDMYAKCGSIVDAQTIFDSLSPKDAVSWTALVSGYMENGDNQGALTYLSNMKHENCVTDVALCICGLKSSGNIQSIEKGQEIHIDITRRGFEEDLQVGNQLVDMYAKCGFLNEAHYVFKRLQNRDIVSWTTLLGGYALLGECQHVLNLFVEMVAEGALPNIISSLGVLYACSHAGYLDLGNMYFNSLNDNHVTSFEHCACMVDLLGRTGHLYKAVVMVDKMPFQPTVITWLTLLGACRKWGDVDTGKYVFQHAIQLDRKNTSVYLSMFNIYIDANMQEEANIVEAMREESHVYDLHTEILEMLDHV